MTTLAEGRTENVAVGAAEAGQRLDRVLAARLPDLSRSRLKALIEGGHVRVDAATIMEPAYRVKPGQNLAVFVPDARLPHPLGQDLALDIIHEDDDVIVVDKPAGMVVHPAPGNPDRTLVNALIAHCGESLSGIGGVRRPGIVHRLDKDTSGVIVAAKNDRAHQALSEQFANHAIERTYIALVWGVPRPRKGRIEGAIGRDPHNRKKMAVVTRGGKAAATRYEVLETFGDTAALVVCRLETGRTHQIRVHMSNIGHPVIGDPLYGRARRGRTRHLAPDIRRALDGFGRQALHAATLGFRHPTRPETINFDAKLPLDFRALIRSLERIKST